MLAAMPRAAQARVFPTDYRFTLDAGYDYLNYTEIHPFQPSESTNGFIQNSVLLDAEFLYYLISHLEGQLGRYSGDLAFFGDASYTLVPISTNISGISSHILRFNLMAGFYQTDMWVTNNQFGYQKLNGPELYPQIHWSQFSQNAVLTDISAFFKYSPVTDGTSSLSWSNREISFGAAARFPTTTEFEYLKQGWEKALVVKLTYADLENTFNIVREVNISSKSLQLSVGYDW